MEPIAIYQEQQCCIIKYNKSVSDLYFEVLFLYLYLVGVSMVKFHKNLYWN